MHHYQIDHTKGASSEAVQGIKTKEVLVYYMASDNGSANVQLLEKILAAANLKTSDYLSLELHQEASNLGSILRKSEISKRVILCFGVAPEMLSLNLRYELNSPLRIGEHVLLLSNSLDELRTNAQLKKPLWNALKMIFGI